MVFWTVAAPISCVRACKKTAGSVREGRFDWRVGHGCKKKNLRGKYRYMAKKLACLVQEASKGRRARSRLDKAWASRNVIGRMRP